MSMILYIVANPEKLQGLLIRFCMTIELGIVNVSPVDGQDVPAGVIGRSEHEAVVRGIGECAATRHHANAQMGKLAGFGEHGVCNLAQGIKAFEHRIEHNDQMLPRIKVLHIPFTTVFTAEFENFRLVKYGLCQGERPDIREPGTFCG